MYKNAQEIFSYLPIRKNQPENDYIEHLWNAFLVLDENESSAHPFNLMPFHLLFMMAVQYKALRIPKIHKKSCKLFFCGVAGRNKKKLLSEQLSVFDIALINERTIPEIFQLIDLETEEISAIKKLIDDRNDRLAHAKGGIEQNSEEKIELYLDALKNIQINFKSINQKLATSWLKELNAGDDINQFLEIYFLNAILCPKDFGDMIKIILEAESIDFDQWQQIVGKGSDFSYKQTVEALKSISKNEIDDGKRFNAIQFLDDNGELDESFKTLLLAKEKDSEIIKLLKS